MNKFSARKALHKMVDHDMVDAGFYNAILDCLDSSTLDKVLHLVIDSISEKDALSALEDYEDGYWLEILRDAKSDEFAFDESYRRKLESRIRRLERASRLNV